jgi:hypothetical protein
MSKHYQDSVKRTLKRRAKSESNIRKFLLNYHNEAKLYCKTTDDLDIDNYVAVFSKSLPHDNNGLVDKTQMNLLLKGLEYAENKFTGGSQSGH